MDLRVGAILFLRKTNVHIRLLKYTLVRCPDWYQQRYYKKTHHHRISDHNDNKSTHGIHSLEKNDNRLLDTDTHLSSMHSFVMSLVPII